MPYLLDEDFPQAGLAKGVVLQVEPVKSVEGVLVCMHVQGVYIQLVPAEVSKNLCYGLCYKQTSLSKGGMNIVTQL